MHIREKASSRSVSKSRSVGLRKRDAPACRCLARSCDLRRPCAGGRAVRRPSRHFYAGPTHGHAEYSSRHVALSLCRDTRRQCRHAFRTVGSSVFELSSAKSVPPHFVCAITNLLLLAGRDTRYQSASPRVQPASGCPLEGAAKGSSGRSR